jgi:hypothetical protein
MNEERTPKKMLNITVKGKWPRENKRFGKMLHGRKNMR